VPTASYRTRGRQRCTSTRRRVPNVGVIRHFGPPRLSGAHAPKTTHAITAKGFELEVFPVNLSLKY